MSDDLPCAPAAERNKEPIRAILAEELPRTGLMLEVAAGTGQHACHMAAAFPDLVWQPTDPDPAALSACDRWRRAHGTPNLRPPLVLDVRGDPWPVERADGRLAINLIHIAPWAACEGLLRGAGRLLPPDGPLILYGPFREAGETAPSNEAFDADLRRRDAAWGVRDLAEVTELAARFGLAPARTVAMPANNRIVVFRRTDRS